MTIVATLAQAQGLGLDTSSYISVALLLVILGAVWRLAVMLTKIESSLHKLKPMPSKLRHIENHLMIFEEDINNLFAAVRAGDQAPILFQNLSRRSRYLPFEGDDQ